MFSGIIKAIGEISSSECSGEDAVLGVRSALFAEGARENIGIGDSIAISGVCLTVTRLKQGCAFFDLASETRRVTTLGLLSLGDKVNLERSLKFGDRLDGHLVQGHVDAVADVMSIQKEENTFRYEFSLPRAVASYIAPKGSISIDGVSLTVGEVSKSSFSVYIIPFTLQETTFQNYLLGTRVNLESDCVARYIHQLAVPYLEK